MRNTKDQTKGKGRGKSGAGVNHEVMQRTTRASSALLPVIPLSTETPSAPEAEKLGREVGYSEIFQVTHKRKGGEGEFVDNKSRVVSEKYNAALVDKYGDDTSSHPSFDGQSWSDAIGGLKTTRTSVYGFGSRVDSRQLFSAPSTGPSTSDSACGPFTYQSFTTNELILQNQLAEKVENLESTVLGIQQGQAGLQSKLDKILELVERGHPTLFSQTSQSGINSRDAGVEGIERGGQGEDA